MWEYSCTQIIVFSHEKFKIIRIPNMTDETLITDLPIFSAGAGYTFKSKCCKVATGNKNQTGS